MRIYAAESICSTGVLGFQTFAELEKYLAGKGRIQLLVVGNDRIIVLHV